MKIYSQCPQNESGLIHLIKMGKSICDKWVKMMKLLISGTNLQALIDFTRDPMNFSAAEIVLVISNKQDALGLKRAENAGIATKVGLHSNLYWLS